MCFSLLLAFLALFWVTRARIVEYAEYPATNARWTDRGPFAHQDHFLALNAKDSILQLLDLELKVVDSIPAPNDIVRLTTNRDMSIVVALEYHQLSIINIKTKARKDTELKEMYTMAFLSPDAAHLWIGEYKTGVMHRYSLKDVDAQPVDKVDIKAEASDLLKPPRLIGKHDFRVAAVKGQTTYLYSDAYSELLIYDWATGKSVGKVALPSLYSGPTFCQSPAGDLLAIVSNHLVIVDLKTNSVLTDVDLEDSPHAGDFNAAGDRFYVGHRSPDLFAIPLTHRGGQIDEYDLSGKRLHTWHSKTNRIWSLGCRGPIAWMVADGSLRTIRLP
jgi:hypothetical protein